MPIPFILGAAIAAKMGSDVIGGVLGRKSAKKAAYAAQLGAEQDAQAYFAIAEENRRRTLQDANDLLAIAEINQSALEEDALAAEHAATIEASGLAVEQNRMLGAQQAAYGASGVVLSSGSPLQVMQDSYNLAIRNVNNVLEQGATQAKRLLSQSGIVGLEAEQHAKRLVDEADILRKTATYEAHRIIRGGQIEGVALKRQGTQMLISGFGNAINTGIGAYGAMK